MVEIEETTVTIGRGWMRTVETEGWRWIVVMCSMVIGSALDSDRVLCCKYSGSGCSLGWSGSMWMESWTHLENDGTLRLGLVKIGYS